MEMEFKRVSFKEHSEKGLFKIQLRVGTSEDGLRYALSLTTSTYGLRFVQLAASHRTLLQKVHKAYVNVP